MTTTRILTWLIKPDEGEAFVAEYDVLDKSIEAKECISVIPKVSNAYIDLTHWKT